LLWQRSRKARKQFFYEKKNQKTFLKSKSFLVLFFKKELLPSFFDMQSLLSRELTSFTTAAMSALCGSIPFGLLLTRAAGLGDIRTIGSGNIGATNVLRTGRRGLAAATLLLDAGKGAAAVQLTAILFGAPWLPLAAMCATAGHCFTPWLGFRGGKGVATGLGALLALDWRVGVGACLTWLLAAALTRLSSAGALAAFAVSPFLAAYLSPPYWWIAPAVIAALVWYRHTANLRRILAGTEPRIGRKE
jgi:glycerol-3-phosphate acyltransferase PlsY